MNNASEKIKLDFFPIFEDTTDKTSSNSNVFKHNMCILIIQAAPRLKIRNHICLHEK